MFATPKEVEQLREIRKKGVNDPERVLDLGRGLVKKSFGLGDEYWTILEQVALASITIGSGKLATECIEILKKKFAKSERVSRLEASLLEAKGKVEEAQELYKSILEKNPCNALVSKRRIALLRSHGSDSDLEAAMLDHVHMFQADKEVWAALGNYYVAKGNFEKASFAYEELLLLDPSSPQYHERVGECYFSLGGDGNVAQARKHFSQAVKMSNGKRMRSLYGLAMATAAQLNSGKTVKNAKELHAEAVRRVKGLLGDTGAQQSLQDIVISSLDSLTVSE